jgi:Leucine-rich repeat (LRR) protein
MQKPEIILQLELELFTQFELVDSNEITEYKKYGKTTQYSLYTNQNINGLCFSDLKLTRIPNSLQKYLQSKPAQEFLTHLDLSRNRISDISALKELKNLTEIDLSGNQISDISAFKKLKNLTEIDLSSNEISDISALKELKNLTKIYLQSNKISNISALKELKNLTEIDLSSNEISDISALKELKNLAKIYLHDNQISNISALKELKNLTKIYLQSNKISDISALKELKNLTQIYLQSNKISDISALKELKNLTEIDLHNNQISDISALKELKNLTEIDIQNNQILKIDEWLTEFNDFDFSVEKLEIWKTWDRKIYLYGNPIENPPLEEVKKGAKYLKNYFKQINEQSTIQLFEAKILIVGEERSGKTTLAQKLFDPEILVSKKNENTGSTLGVVVSPGRTFNYQEDKEKKISANIWDFGGQDIQYYIHQYFLTPDSLYIYIDEARRINLKRADYWFQIIALQSGKCPVILLHNRIDYKDNIVFPLQKYADEFTGLQISECDVDFTQNNRKWNNLLDLIEEKLSALPVVAKTVPAYWKPVRDEIEKRKTENYLSLPEFYKICESNKLTEEEDQQTLLIYLNSIGVALHFKDELDDTVFINPNWITQGLYKILSDDTIRKQNNGCFTKSWFYEKLKDYKSFEKNYLLKLMLKNNFDVCYKLANTEDTYIVPKLLPETAKIYSWENDGNIKFRYQYAFIPEGILSRFIVRMYRFIENNTVWLTGVVLSNGLCRALVQEVESVKDGRKNIVIEIWGTNKESRKSFLSLIRHEIDFIHQSSFKMLNVDEMVICNCHECTISDEPEFYTLKTLENKIRKKPTIECHKSSIDVNIIDLVNDVYLEQKIENQAVRNWNKEMVRDFENVLVQAFPNISELERLCLYGLNTELNRLVDNSNNLTIVCFDLIRKVQSLGKIELLVAGAKNENPGNPELADFLRKYNFN